MDSFQRELESAFGGRFRLRWSQKSSAYQLEQKVATGQVLPPPVDESGTWDTYSDEWIRATEGYFLVMEIRSGDRMPCPVCGAEVKVPVLETRETHCHRCMVNGLDGRLKAAYYPLNHVLIDHLRDIDPLNGGPQRVRQRMRAKQLERQGRELDKSLDMSGEAIMDDKYQVEQRPMTGYGPKTAQRGDHTRFE